MTPQVNRINGIKLSYENKKKLDITIRFVAATAAYSASVTKRALKEDKFN